MIKELFIEYLDICIRLSEWHVSNARDLDTDKLQEARENLKYFKSEKQKFLES